MKIKSQSHPVFKRKRILIGLVIATALLILGLLAYWSIFARSNDSITNPNIEAEAAKNNPENKEVPGNSVENPEEKENNTEQSASNITPFISYFGRTGSDIEVNAFVPGINEDGICTLTVTNKDGSEVYRQSKPAHAGAQATKCENFLFADTGADSNWKAVISYKSQLYSGDSKPAQFK